MVWRVREVSLLFINVRVLPVLSSTHFLKFTLDPLAIHENQYCYIAFWKVLNYNINRTWKVKLLYILLIWYPGKENAFIFSPSNTSRHAIYFNWFNTHNHIKISWKVQLRCCFTYLPSCLWRLFTIEIQLILGTVLPSLNYTFPLAVGESQVGLPSFPKTLVIFLTRHTLLVNELLLCLPPCPLDVSKVENTVRKKSERIVNKGNSKLTFIQC